jgi:hypothetical protein
MKQLKTKRVMSSDDISAIVWPMDQRVLDNDINVLVWVEM